MLSRMETFYLAILRVIILVAATLALIATVIGFIGVVPSMLRWTGVTAEEPKGGTLNEFISERKITETTANADPSDPSAFEPLIYDDIKTAASTIAKYLGSRASTTDEASWRTGLQRAADSFGDNSMKYAASVKRLAAQLAKSKGAPLSEGRVLELFDWHKTRFVADVMRQSSIDAENNAQFWFSLGAAGAAFLAFVLIIFIFLFVKIERSLRVIRAIPITASPAIDAE